MFSRVGAKGVVIIPGYTATSRKVVRKNVHVKGNMGYDQYSVPDTTAVEVLTFVAFLYTNKHTSMASLAILSNCFEQQ